MEEEVLKIASERLLKWYDGHARVLPWRELVTPYRVWVSEIMLQQTRVEAVLPYYDRFLRELPDVASLAAVSEEKLMLLWQGLGYYARARNLKKAACEIMERFHGEIPSTFEELESLSGIGVYTAGAISSIAFGERRVAVDGNVFRVLSRLLECDWDIGLPETLTHFAQIAEKMQPASRPGDFNQAIMELGAIVCIPTGYPKCEVCPWSELCLAHKNGRETDFPVRKKRNPRKIEKRTVLLVTDGEQVLLRKRPEKGLLAGMWEFPNAPRLLPERAIRAQLRTWRMEHISTSELPSDIHIFTHVEWHMLGRLVRVKPCECPEDYLWVAVGELSNYAIPSAFSTYVEEAEKIR